MENALIVSHAPELRSTERDSGEGAAFYSDVLKSSSIKHITVLHSAGEARRLLLKQDFDLVIVDSPLPDESGESLSRHIASKDAAQVILVVNSGCFDAVSAACEDDGVFTLSRPMERSVLRLTLKFAASAQSRLRRVQDENGKLKKKIEDIRIIERAKYILISYLKMTEQEAHRFIEKQAMDMRFTRRAIAEGILKTYAN